MAVGGQKENTQLSLICDILSRAAPPGCIDPGTVTVAQVLLYSSDLHLAVSPTGRARFRSHWAVIHFQGTRIVAQALLAIPHAPPRCFAHWARSASVPPRFSSPMPSRHKKRTHRLVCPLWWSIGESPLGARRASVKAALRPHCGLIHYWPRFSSPMPSWHKRKNTPFGVFFFYGQ